MLSNKGGGASITFIRLAQSGISSSYSGRRAAFAASRHLQKTRSHSWSSEDLSAATRPASSFREGGWSWRRGLFLNRGTRRDRRVQEGRGRLENHLRGLGSLQHRSKMRAGRPRDLRPPLCPMPERGTTLTELTWWPEADGWAGQGPWAGAAEEAAPKKELIHQEGVGAPQRWWGRR